MTLGNTRQQGVQHLVAYCHNDACRHQAIIDVSKYPERGLWAPNEELRRRIDR